MFERFTKAARDAVVQAQQEARTLGHGRIGTEHILLAMLSATDRPPAQVLAAMGLTYDEARAAVRRYVGTDDLDADALGTIGIDLGAVREKVEQVFGPGALDRPRGSRAPLGGHVPFAPAPRRCWSSRCARPSGSSTTSSPTATSCWASCARARGWR
ncbi:Clp protease N-terminal domain-containing protein [Thermocatellispora tengchongensis]|uniref:Clp protease N-terminal domain-containing protein n=1 Tax=Thermocatellispora tengchongensis TaxID=1073253 RepID=UPI00362DCC54